MALTAVLLVLALARSAAGQAAAPVVRGPVTYNFDVTSFSDDGYFLNINAFNLNPQCRKLLGWTLTWTFPAGEFVWAATGIRAQDTGDCSQVYPAGGGTPYACNKTLSFVDARPQATGALTINQSFKSCKVQACANLLGSVKMQVGNATNTVVGFMAPSDYQMQGYACGAPVDLAPARNLCRLKSPLSWRVTCTPLPQM